MIKSEEYNTGRENIPSYEMTFFKRLIRIFELMKADKTLLKDFHRYISDGSLKEAWLTLKSYNDRMEKDQKVNISRPYLHGFNEQETFTKIVQESYVTAKLFKADDRLLNAMWNEDWEEAGRQAR